MNEYEISLQVYVEGRLYSEKATKENKKLVIFDNLPSINPTDNQKGINNK